MATTINTILEKQKKSMEIGTFLFKFRNIAPVAIHKDWLFKTHISETEYYPEVKEVMIAGDRTFLLLTNLMALTIGDVKYTGFFEGIDYTSGTDSSLPSEVVFKGIPRLLKYKELSKVWSSGIDPSTLSEKEKDFYNLIYPLKETDKNYSANRQNYNEWKPPYTFFKDIKKIVGNKNNILVLTNKGELYGAGNDPALLGLGKEDAELPNHFVRLTKFDDIVDVWCGEDFSFIKRKDGTFMASGSNKYGQLGTGELVEVIKEPTIEYVEFIPGETYKYYGDFQTVAELEAAIILNDNLPSSSPDKKINFKWPIGRAVFEERIEVIEKTYEFIEVEALKNAILFDCGLQHIVATKNIDNVKGQFYIAGRNNYGQLGIGAGNEEIRMELEEVSGLTNVLALSAKNSNNTLIVIKTYQGDNELRVTGDNTYGQLGLGSSVTYETTFQPAMINIRNINKVYTGRYNTFYITDGTSDDDNGQCRLFGAGYNKYRLLNNTTEDRYSSYIRVTNKSLEYICVGDKFMILKTDMNIESVGIDDYGQLCNGKPGKPIGETIAWGSGDHKQIPSPILLNWNTIFPSNSMGHESGKIYTSDKFVYNVHLHNKWGGQFEPIDSIFYKNDNETWIDWIKLNGKFNGLNVYHQANLVDETYKVKDKFIPAVEYTDAEGYVHYINKRDNKSVNFNNHIIHNTSNQPPYSLEFTNYHKIIENQPFQDYEKDDLKITFLNDHFAKDFLVWMNGIFVDLHPDLDDPKVGYIIGASAHIPAIEKCKSDNTLVNLKNNNTATVDENDKISELRYDIKLKFFGWENVKISRPDVDYFSFKSETIKFDGKMFEIAKEIGYKKLLHKDKTLVLLNGVILPENAYEIVNYKSEDGSNVSNIVLKNYKSWVLSLLIESFSREHNYFDKIHRMVSSNSFSIITIESKDDEQDVFFYRDRRCVKNAPYVGEVLFDKVRYDELILIDGHYLNYEWLHEKAIRYPTKTYLATQESSDFIERADIYRLRTYLE